MYINVQNRKGIIKINLSFLLSFFQNLFSVIDDNLFFFRSQLFLMKTFVEF